MGDKPIKFIFGAKHRNPQTPFKFTFNGQNILPHLNTVNIFPMKKQFFINDLCDELLLHIFTFMIPDISCDFNQLLKLRLVCHKWKELIDSPYIWMTYAKIINIYFYLYNKFRIKYNISNFLEKKYTTLDKTDRTDLLKSVFNSKKILSYDIYKKITIVYSNKLINAIGHTNLINAPVIEMDSLCLDHVCGSYCNDNNHFLHQKIKAPIMRGIDNTGRPFILFVYKNILPRPPTHSRRNWVPANTPAIYNDQLIYEFIYNNFTHHYVNNIPNNLWTYSGQTPDTYIGNLSYKKSWFDIYTNTFTDNLNRKLLNKSYNYIERLVNGDDCGIPKYEVKYDNYWEFGLCQESHDVCPTFHLDYRACEDCIYCENCVYEGEVTLYWKSGFLGNEYISL